MKKPLPGIFLAVAVFAFYSANAQVYNTGGLFIASAGTIYINDSFYHTSSAVYQNNGTLTLEGNFINNSTSLSGTGTTIFTNTSTQQIEGTQTSVFGSGIIQSTSNMLLKQNATFTGSLTINAGNNANINGNTLTVNSGFLGTGKLRGSATSNLVAGGSGNIYFNPADYYLHDFTINNGATLNLGDSLNIVAGTAFGTVIANGALTSNGYLTMKSNALGTARVGISTDSVRGDVTVERYIPPRRAWRFLSFPFKSSTQTLRDAWQEGVNNTDINYANNKDPKPGFGMHITGDNNTSLGYDFNTTVNASVKTWIQATKSWTTTTPPTNTTNITAFNAYCAFVRGSRAVNLSLATSSPTYPTVLRGRGKLSFGVLSKNYTANVGEMLFVGNPYASSINIATLISSTPAIQPNKFWVWDPVINGTYGVGAYVTYDNGMMVPSTGSYPVATTVIQGGQGFFVQANNTSVSLGFQEGYKTASESNVFGRIRQPKLPPRVYINLMQPSGDTLALLDGVGAMYASKFSDSVDINDANKMYTFNENIMLMRQNTRLAIEARPFPSETDTLFMRMLFLKTQDYILQTTPADVPPSVKEAWLIDKYLQTEYSLSLTDVTNYSFAANSDTNSYISRFRIVFTLNKTGDVKNTIACNNNHKSAHAEKFVTIKPNPVLNGRLQVGFAGMAKGDYELDLYATSGNMVLRKEVNHSGSNNTYEVLLQQNLPQGVYNLFVVNRQTKEVISLPVIVGR